jgi:hypothetical protein
LVVALVCGNIGGVPVLPFGLGVHELVIWPLTFGISAIFAAIGAGWAGNLLAPDHARSRFLPIVGVSEVAATIVTVIAVAGFVLHRATAQDPAQESPFFVPPIYRFGFGVIFIALSASAATWHFRTPRSSLGKDVAITMGLVGLAVLVFVATVYVAGHG